MPYADDLKTIGPRVLRGPNGQALSGQTGAALDDQRNRLLQGVLARFPTKGSVDATGTYGPPPSDALDQQLADRLLRRGPGESDANAGARVLEAWDDWEFGGAHWGVLRQLQIAGYANVVAVQDNGRYAQLTGSSGNISDLSLGNLMTCIDRSGNTPGWMFDALRGSYWSQWGLVFTADATDLQTVDGQAILNSIVATWGPGNARYVAAWVILAGAGCFGWPTGQTWGASTWGGDSVRTIPGDGSAAFVTGP